MLLDTWRRAHGGSLHHLSDLRRPSVVHLAELMDEDPAHSAQVARLALELFDATADRHGLGDDSRELLEAAALLANVGLFVSHAGHHKHSYYVIRNTEQLTGLHRPRDRADRPGRPLPPQARAPPQAPRVRRARATTTSDGCGSWPGLLRVAVGLDRNHSGRVGSVAVAPDGDGPLVVEVLPADGQDVSLEMYAATARSGLLAEALGAPVEVVEVVDRAVATPA